MIMLRDSWEERPVVSSDAELVNPLTNKIMAKRVSKKAIEHYEKLYKHFNTHQIKYVKIYEKDEIFEKLEQLFYF